MINELFSSGFFIVFVELLMLAVVCVAWFTNTHDAFLASVQIILGLVLFFAAIVRKQSNAARFGVPGFVAFNAYRKSMLGRTYDNKPIPQWTDLPDNVRQGWGEACNAVVTFITTGQRKQ